MHLLLTVDAEEVIAQGSTASFRVFEQLGEKYSCTGTTHKILREVVSVEGRFSDHIWGIGGMAVDVVGVFESTATEGIDTWRFGGVVIPRDQRFDFTPLIKKRR